MRKGDGECGRGEEEGDMGKLMDHVEQLVVWSIGSWFM